MRRKNNSFMDHLEYYLVTYLPTVKGLSDATIVSYKASFRILMEFLYSVKGIPADKVGFNLLDDKLIIEFLDWLESARGCGIATRNQRLSAIAAFAMYAQNRNFDAATCFRNSVLKVPRKKTSRKGRSSFTRDEVRILFELPDARTKIGLRDKTLLCFMYASGTRAQEACDLTVGDIQFYPDRAGINIHGKGQKVRRIGIPFEASEMLKKYIAHRGLANDYKAHVFSSQTHARRKYDEALKALPKDKRTGTLANTALRLIQAIYREERKLSALSPEERLKQRKEKIAPLVEAYFSWVHQNYAKALKGTKTEKGMQYSLNQEKYLRVFLTDGEVPLDNNGAERSIRPLCIEELDVL